jgi:GxxExxY protein
MSDFSMPDNLITDKVIGAAIEVHRHLGPGLLESAYEECLCYELTLVGLSFERQVHLPIAYKGLRLDSSYSMDLVVEGRIIVEIKAIEELLPIHSAQVLTYLKSSGKEVGLLINFNETVLKRGLKRIVNQYTGPNLSPRDETAADSLLSSPRLSPRHRDSAVTVLSKDRR